jgi:hypothetical protein
MTMISSAFRQGARRVAATSSRRGFSSAATNVAKNENARKALFATAGLSLAVAGLLQREVSCDNDVPSYAFSLAIFTNCIPLFNI